MSRPTSASLCALLWAAADRSPEAAAVAAPTGAATYTYRSLRDDAARIGNCLVELGVERGDRVALYIEDRAHATAALFGALASGAAYVPLDTSAPLARNGRIVIDAEPSAVITETAFLDDTLALLDSCPFDLPVVLIDGPATWEAQPTSPPSVDIGSDDLAYLLYTSGSTGQPKGVTLTHGNALAFVDWAVRTTALAAADRVAAVAPLHFDLSVFDVFAPVAAGATVVPVPPDSLLLPRRAVRLIENASVTVWYSVPSVLTRLLEFGRPTRDALASLRVVLFAGEVFPPRQLRRLMELVPAARFLNLYGPTETNVCTWHEVHAPLADDEPVPIGRPIDGVGVAVVRDDGEACVEPGDVGELWVSGSTVMRGYWNDVAATSRALASALPGTAVGPAYRTGDLVRSTPAGDLVFVGRRDHQIKSMGHRIELGEVEAAFASSPDVIEAVAVAIPDDDAGTALEAFVVLREGADLDTVTARVREILPRYMVPARVHVVDELPRTSTGKVDRRSLHA